MENIVAVAVELSNRKRRYFLTWGRIQAAVESAPLEALVLKHAAKFDLGGVPRRARLCSSLHEAANEAYFHECFFEMCRKGIPEGRKYEAWRKRVNALMRRGGELYYLGKLQGTSR